MKGAMLTIWILALALIFCSANISEAAPMGTAFTYQGFLYDANSPADDIYDFEFTLYDANEAGSLVAGPVAKEEVDVYAGVFTTEIDFGGDVFDGNDVWLEVGVRPGPWNDPNVYTTLDPRQEVTPTPYALHTRWFLVDEALGNIFAGEGAGANNTTGWHNSAVGYNALYRNTTGYWNSAMGMQALQSNTTAYSNSAVGYRALYRNTTGFENSAMGSNALQSNTTAWLNSAMGSYALQSNIGSRNSAMGAYALRDNTTGSMNSAMGESALRSNTTGGYNSAMGYHALYSNTTSDYNSAMGYFALYSNTTGRDNSAMGSHALRYNTTGNHNSAMGSHALQSNTTGGYNSAMGFCAGFSNSTGHRNVFLGYGAGYNETGSDRLYIANSDANIPLIYGEFDTGRVGIGTTDPNAMLDVNGSLILENGSSINEFSTDGTLGDDSDDAVPTEKAVKTYVDNQISAGGFGVVPVGSIIAWGKSFPNTPSLSSDFVECNGQTLSDAESPYDGQTIPNLNGASAGTQRFLRGSTASGATGGSETHNHTLDSIGSSPSMGPYSIGELTTNSTSTLPSYYEVVWIMRVK